MAPARQWNPAKVAARLRVLNDAREHGWDDMKAKAQANPQRAPQADHELAWLDLLTRLVGPHFRTAADFEDAVRQSASEPHVTEEPYNPDLYRRIKLQAAGTLIAEIHRTA